MEANKLLLYENNKQRKLLEQVRLVIAIESKMTVKWLIHIRILKVLISIIILIFIFITFEILYESKSLMATLGVECVLSLCFFIEIIRMKGIQKYFHERKLIIANNLKGIFTINEIDQLCKIIINKNSQSKNQVSDRVLIKNDLITKYFDSAKIILQLKKQDINRDCTIEIRKHCLYEEIKN